MTSTRLDGKGVLLTQSADCMGPALTEVFRDWRTGSSNTPQGPTTRPRPTRTGNLRP